MEKSFENSFMNKHEIAKKTSLIQVRLTAKADGNLQKLVSTTGIKNRTQLVNAAIDLAADVLATIQKGGSVIYELPDGSKERLKVVGV